MLWSLWILLAAGSPHAETLRFPEVWRQIDAASPAQDAARLSAAAATAAEARAGRHWLPRLYLDARSWSTNDPASSFMGLLEQRSVRASDFAPDSLSHPEAHLYSRAGLGIDLPLYQGGSGAALAAVTGAEANARAEEAEQVRIEQYAEAGRSYAALAATHRALGAFETLSAEVHRLQKGYRLGSKANPVGYSGSLGLKALANKVEALVRQAVAQRHAARSELRELGVAGEAWAPEELTAADFVSRYLSARAGSEASHRVGALRAQAESGREAVGLQRSRFLPQLGLFAEGYGFSGNRDTATGYSGGFYLRWSLFDPQDYGSLREASLRAASAERFAEASVRRERAAREGLDASLPALRANVATLAETDALLAEQAGVTETLFRSGSINVLQFLEVLNRRADLSAQRLEAELAYLKAASEALGTRRADVAALAGEGK